MIKLSKAAMLAVALVSLCAATFATVAKDVAITSSLAGVVADWKQPLSSGRPLYLGDALHLLGVPRADVDPQQASIIAAVSAEGLKARPGYAMGWHFDGAENVRSINFGIKPETHVVASISVQLAEQSCLSSDALLKPVMHLSSHPAGGDGTQARSCTHLRKYGTYSVLFSKKLQQPDACAQTLTLSFDNS